jgi:translation initiation factor IF-2
LARELGVTSKDILAKCRAEGLDIKNHMTALSAGLEATVREWFSEGSVSTAVETTDHVDLEEMRAKAAKKRRRRKKKEEEEAPAEEAPAATAVAEEESAEAKGETAEEEPTEAPPEQAAVAAEEAAEAKTEEPAAEVAAEEAPQAEEPPVVEEAPPAVEEAPPAEPPVEAPAAEEAKAPPAEEEEPADAPAVAAEKSEAEPQAPAAEEEKPEEGEEGQEGEEGEEGAEPGAPPPAGPQVVPKPAALKGPRVVRVEKPDFVRRPKPKGRPRPGSPGGRGGRGGPQQAPAPAIRRGMSRAGGGAKDEEERRGKGKKSRRSPRRKGRTAESGSGEKLKEWRNQDLIERSQRLAAAGSGLRRHRASVGRGQGQRGPQIKTGKVEIEEPFTIKDLSAATGVKSAQIIRHLMADGMLATVNQVIEADKAQEIMLEYDIELVVKKQVSAEDELIEQFEKRETGEQFSRAPVVTFLGHVDHGKTSLLDYIRKTAVADGEAGGITQHMGAYRYDRGDSHVVFLDTPGHEAFTAMRARGANMTDVVVLVVAADDGVMPQTIEAISHAKAAGVPIVVAMNKVDVPNANVNRALGQLAEHDLQPQEWGGDTEVIHTSAMTGEGIDTLVETLSLEAELLELKAEKDGPASGFVIEAEMDPGRGVVARMLVMNGTLRVGDDMIAGRSYGRVRAMTDPMNNPLEEAGPATPIILSGLDEVPEAGDKFYVADSIDQAREIAEDRREAARERQLKTKPGRSLESLLSRMDTGELSEVNLIIKTDVQGTTEAVVGAVTQLNSDEVRVSVIHQGVGGITTGDVTLAEASDAIIIGFNVVADAAARKAAEECGVEIRTYRVIYDITEDIRRVLEEGLAPEVREETLGRAEIRQVFKSSRHGNIAGCIVTDGTVNRNAKVRITRNNVVIEDGRELDSLKRFKDDVREVRAGMECGLKIARFDDIKEGDILEFYQQVEVARTL